MSLQIANMPLVSVIVPVYNVAKYLSRCLDSILTQTYKNLEIILVDDGSTDRSGQICDSYAATDLRVRVLHKANGGVSSARNCGIEESRGEYISFVDPDDYISPHMYETLLHCAQQHQVDMVICKYIEEKIDGERSVSVFPYTGNFLYLSMEEWMNQFITTIGYQTVWNKLFTRKIIGNTRFLTEFVRAEDVYFSAEIARKLSRIFVCDQPLYFYVHREDSTMKIREIYPFICAYEAWKKIELQWKNYGNGSMRVAFRSLLIKQTCLLAILIVVLDTENKYVSLLQELQRRFANNVDLCKQIKRLSVRYWILCFAKLPKTTQFFTRLPGVRQGINFYIQHK